MPCGGSRRQQGGGRRRFGRLSEGPRDGRSVPASLSCPAAASRHLPTRRGSLWHPAAGPLPQSGPNGAFRGPQPRGFFVFLVFFCSALHGEAYYDPRPGRGHAGSGEAGWKRKEVRCLKEGCKARCLAIAAEKHPDPDAWVGVPKLPRDPHFSSSPRPLSGEKLPCRPPLRRGSLELALAWNLFSEGAWVENAPSRFQSHVLRRSPDTPQEGGLRKTACRR